MNFQFYLILINLHVRLNSHMCLVATVLGSAAVEHIQNSDIKDNLIYKLKLRTGFRENHFISFYQHLILDQKLPSLGFLTAFFYYKKKRFIRTLQNESNTVQTYPKLTELPRGISSTKYIECPELRCHNCEDWFKKTWFMCSFHLK